MVLFIDGCVSGGAVDLGRGGDEHPLHITVPTRLQNVQCPFDVRIDVQIGGMVGERDSDQSGEVKDDIHSRHGLIHPVWVPDVAGINFDLSQSLFRESVQPTPGIEGIIEDERPDVIPRV